MTPSPSTQGSKLNGQQISIRYGLLLQACVGVALRNTKYSSFVETPKYDEDQMTPDFLIPDDRRPRFALEVTRTEHRDSFRRKFMRYFEAVCDVKSHFGCSVISISILFGDTSALPANNVRALNAVFDANLCPQSDANSEDVREAFIGLEAEALQVASDPLITNVAKQAAELATRHGRAFAQLAQELERTLDNASVKAELKPLWLMEAQRTRAQTDLNVPISESIDYKRPLIQTLFFSDFAFRSVLEARSSRSMASPLLRDLAAKDLLTLHHRQRPIARALYRVTDADITSLMSTYDLYSLSSDAQDRLVDAGLVVRTFGTGIRQQQVLRLSLAQHVGEVLACADSVPLSKEFVKLLDDHLAETLRCECQSIVKADESLSLFFEDIQSEQRRDAMSEHFLSVMVAGEEAIEEALRRNLEQHTYADIDHARCWIADLLPLYIQCSHNDFNTAMVRSSDYHESLGNPYNNITIKAPRVMGSRDIVRSYIRPAVSAFRRLAKSHAPLSGPNLVRRLSFALLRLRMHGAMSLQKFVPMHIFIRAAASAIGASARYSAVDSVIGDLVSDVESVGKFDVFVVERDGKEVIVNGLYVDRYGGRDKAKEWSARGRAILYRSDQGEIRRAVQGLIFVADGPWKPEAIRRLREGGWDVCRAAELQQRMLTALSVDDALHMAVSASE